MTASWRGAWAILTALALAACGSTAGPARAGQGTPPRSVEIRVSPVNGTPTTIRIDDPAVAQRLHGEASRLPRASAGGPCIAIVGPRYEMTFRAGEETTATVAADRGGCGLVTLGKDDVRQADDAFWRALDQAIDGAAPRAEASPSPAPSRPDRLSYQVEPATGDPNPAPRAGELRDADMVARLYETLRGLPPLRPAQACIAQVGARYTLIFSHGGTTLLAAQADSGGCGTVTLQPGDVRQASPEVWELLRQITRG